MKKPLGYILGQTKRVYSNKLATKFKENNVELSLELFIILFHIELNEEVTQQQLADNLQKDKSFVMRQINSLRDKKYVARTGNKQDKRKKNLVLTQKGREILELTKSMARSVSEELLFGVSDDEQLAFERVIDVVWKNGTSDVRIF